MIDLYEYEDQGGKHVISRDEIISSYFEYWKQKMIKAGKEDLISEDNCISDFIVIHWAYKI